MGEWRMEHTTLYIQGVIWNENLQGNL
jgi:hypothetical protein